MNMSKVVVLYQVIKIILKPIRLHIAWIVYWSPLYVKLCWIKLKIIHSNGWIDGLF